MTGTQLLRDVEMTDELCSWARANGMDPDRISMNDGHIPEIWDGQVCVAYLVRDEDGREVYDEIHRTRVVRPHWFPITHPLPAHLGRPIEQTEQVPVHPCTTCAPQISRSTPQP